MMTAIASPIPDSQTPPRPMTDPVTMQCLQVWGGNQATDQALRLTGLDGYLVSRPYADADAGGDVYYASSCASGRITRVILADVAGHGEAVARFAQDLRKLMQRFVNFTSHRKFIAALNQAYSEMTEDGRFATAVTLSYYAPKNDLHLINAGHPPPLYYHAASDRWSLLYAGDEPEPDDALPPADLPLGVEQGVGYRKIRRKLAADDLLLLYTDALIEAKDPGGRQLGVPGLLATIRSLTEGPEAMPPERLLPALLSHLSSEGQSAATLAGDDTTALLLRATGEKRQWGKVLTSPIHLVRGMAKGSLPTFTQ